MFQVSHVSHAPLFLGQGAWSRGQEVSHSPSMPLHPSVFYVYHLFSCPLLLAPCPLRDWASRACESWVNVKYSCFEHCKIRKHYWHKQESPSIKSLDFQYLSHLLSLSPKTAKVTVRNRLTRFVRQPSDIHSMTVRKVSHDRRIISRSRERWGYACQLVGMHYLCNQ